MSGRSRAVTRSATRAFFASAAVALTGFLAGCGAGQTASERGRAIFRSSCSGCHTLSGREHGTVGGDLVLAGLSVADLASFARTMPVRPPLSRVDALAVAEYVHRVTEKRGEPPRR